MKDLTKDQEIVERIKKSKDQVGQLYPILIDRNDQIIDGQHRKEADPNWRTVKINESHTKEDRLARRLVCNHARKSSTPDTWMEDLEDLAKEFAKSYEPGEIGKLIAIKTGLPYRTIMKYLPKEYKRSEGYSSKVETVELHECNIEPNPNIVETPITIKDLFEITMNVSLPKVQVKAFKNMPWTAIMVETKFMEDLKDKCKRNNIEVPKVMATALEYIKERLSDEKETA